MSLQPAHCARDGALDAARETRARDGTAALHLGFCEEHGLEHLRQPQSIHQSNSPSAPWKRVLLQNMKSEYSMNLAMLSLCMQYAVSWMW